MRAERCGPAEAPEAEFNIPRMYIRYPASLNFNIGHFLIQLRGRPCERGGVVNYEQDPPVTSNK